LSRSELRDDPDTATTVGEPGPFQDRRRRIPLAEQGPESILIGFEAAASYSDQVSKSRVIRLPQSSPGYNSVLIDRHKASPSYAPMN
jgi:hypothetical protein